MSRVYLWNRPLQGKEIMKHETQPGKLSLSPASWVPLDSYQGINDLWPNIWGPVYLEESTVVLHRELRKQLTDSLVLQLIIEWRHYDIYKRKIKFQFCPPGASNLVGNIYKVESSRQYQEKCSKSDSDHKYAVYRNTERNYYLYG